jgi:hypothetical protein
MATVGNISDGNPDSAALMGREEKRGEWKRKGKGKGGREKYWGNFSRFCFPRV